MAELPSSPVSPSHFFEEFLPSAFAEGEVPEDLRQVEAKLGVRLEGEGGGEWLLDLAQGALRVVPGSREEAVFTVVQTVDDWRGALWEGRGGFVGRQAAQLLQPGPRSAGPGGLGAPGPAVLGQLAALQGVIRMVVAGGPGGDWRVDFKLGPGAIPEEPTTTLTIADADAAAIERGELDPLQAFMAGRIQIAGDMAFVMQMQALSMQAASGAGPGGSGGAAGGGGAPGR